MEIPKFNTDDEFYIYLYLLIKNNEELLMMYNNNHRAEGNGFDRTITLRIGVSDPFIETKTALE